MCGIVGFICHAGTREAVLDGLARLEYRGYDSAGIALLDNGSLKRVAVAGRVSKLGRAAGGIDGSVGIGHTRWATHGAPTERNAHPVCAGIVAVVHNGIIENNASLRREIESYGRKFSSDTDSEVVAHLLDQCLTRGESLLDAVRTVMPQLDGTSSIAVIAHGGDEIVCAHGGCPLAVGKLAGMIFVSSDVRALAGGSVKACFLENGDCALLGESEISVLDSLGERAGREWHKIESEADRPLAGVHKHHMLGEIHAQPEAVRASLAPYLGRREIRMRQFGSGVAKMFRDCASVCLLGCGTSHHAALVAVRWLRELGVPCRAELSSEYRHAADPQASTSLVIAISQSGETADTLAAMRVAKGLGSRIIALVNTRHSQMTREADCVVLTCAGLEVGVASTKTHTSQLALLALLALAIAEARDGRGPRMRKLLDELRLLPHLLTAALQTDKQMREWAGELAKSDGALFIGRGGLYPAALEGALKIKEISYLHAEGCAAGELKHGTLALVDAKMPVVGLVQEGVLGRKMASSLAEVAARGGRIFALNSGSAKLAGENVARVSGGGANSDWLLPAQFAVPLQLLAYHVAELRGTDIDRPRNLAKSVTVE